MLKNSRKVKHLSFFSGLSHVLFGHSGPPYRTTLRHHVSAALIHQGKPPKIISLNKKTKLTEGLSELTVQTKEMQNVDF